MNSTEKDISYTSYNSYSTLNNLKQDTQSVWFVCHGMGYLSRYFLKYFKGLNEQDNYIIAPQAPSKYYQQPKMYVGANWLTKDNTSQGVGNVINYFDAIFKNESLPPKDKEFIVLGYSQGVSVALRYLAKRQIQCDKLIIHSGGIPKELESQDFEYLNPKCKVYLVYGNNDEYLTEERIKDEIEKAKALFPRQLKICPFEGKHMVNEDFIKNL
jgi:predicted esterase